MVKVLHGITAALYIKRAGLNCLVIGKDGGALEKAKTIENYYGCSKIPSKQLIINGIKQAQDLGIEVKTDEVCRNFFWTNWILYYNKKP